jgi:hypothetical protein
MDQLYMSHYLLTTTFLEHHFIAYYIKKHPGNPRFELVASITTPITRSKEQQITNFCISIHPYLKLP